MGYLQRCWVVEWLVSCVSAAIAVHSVYTMQPCTMSHHFMQSHIHRMHAYLAVTYLHIWQNDQGLLCATVATQGWNEYQNKESALKLTLENNILPRLLLGLEPATLLSRVHHSIHWAIPTPQLKNKYSRTPITVVSHLIGFHFPSSQSHIRTNQMYCIIQKLIFFF